MDPTILNTVKLNISEHFKAMLQFVKSISFSRAILVGIAVSLPLLLGIQLGYFEIGLALSFGAFWCSPSDISGSFRHKEIGILFSSALVMLVSFIGGYLHYESWLALPVLGILSFGIAYLSVFGFRASLISLSGLLAMVVSFAHEAEELQVYQTAVLIGAGGLWYLLLAKLWQRINSKAETEELLTATFVLTAEFLTTRGKLVDPHEDHNKLQAKLLSLQSQLTENHEILREILILSRKASGWSNYQNMRLLIFAQLIEMLETAIANPVNYDRMDALFNNHPQFIKAFQKIIFEMSRQLRAIPNAGNDANKLPKNDYLRQCFEGVRSEIELLRETQYYDEYLMLQNLLEYQEKLFTKLKRIKWLLGDPNTLEVEYIDRKVAKRFVALQNYDPRLLIRNFSFKSAIFRHSFRLAVTVMLGYALGSLFPFQNPHWILLTIIVIMRPSYGLTKTRAKDRFIGTLIGGAIASVLVFMVQDPYLYGTMALVSLVVAMSLLHKNNKASTIFITLSVAFIYAIAQPDILTLIKFRILDTLVGAGLSYAAILWLLPTWEFIEIKDRINNSIKANTKFLHKITEFYQRKGTVPTSYNIARKQAFVETSNLSSAFQRMGQEPKSKQRETDKIYELIVLNHTFLTSLASLSTYIRNHPTNEASEPFQQATAKIEHNLKKARQCLNQQYQEAAQIYKDIDQPFEEQLPNFHTLDFDQLESNDEASVRNLQEAHLVWEQLQWLFAISNKILKLAATVKLD